MKAIEKDTGVKYHEMDPGDRVRVPLPNGNYIEVVREDDGISVSVSEDTLVVLPLYSNRVAIAQRRVPV